jgi:predicted transcriptional regulator
MSSKNSNIIPVRLPDEIKAAVELVAQETGLSQQAVLRKATEFGLPIIRRAMSSALAEAQGKLAA